MLPVLTAQESLAHINELAVGFGSMDKQAAQQFLFALRTTATIRRRGDRGAVRPRSAGELSMLSEGAIAVVLEPGPEIQKATRRKTVRAGSSASPTKGRRRPQVSSQGSSSGRAAR